MRFAYHNPVAITAGADSVEALPKVLAGRSVVLVTFPEAEGLGLVTRLRGLLGARLRAVEDQIEPNPDVRFLTAMYERFWREHGSVDALVAVGGGSAIDSAKALMVGTASGTFQELINLLATGGTFVPHRAKPLIAVPTTAGTGSEVTPWATIWDRTANKKHSLHLPQTWPEAAIVDPNLMLTLPASVTLQSGLDALSHALESIWNINANPISDNFAVAAAREVLAALPALMKDLPNPGLRARMALAALNAGLAFSNTKTALAHSISYEMTLRFGLPHGIACSFTLPMVLQKALGIDPERDAVLARIFGELADAPQKLAEFLHALGVPTDFGAYGVTESDAQAMVLNATQGVRGRNFIVSPTLVL
ncbi:MAG TPA: iron-containing alcohol dehydrogenase PsrA [Burkholderiaceae bacterium]|nr:iron-containing alcohol dehydrogenase PsrA [Burkholderiaceae bacterium]